jgi:hypothetical protein
MSALCECLQKRNYYKDCNNDQKKQKQKKVSAILFVRITLQLLAAVAVHL